jgi:phage tail-like protein
MDKTAVASHFSVVLDQVHIGNFTKVDGLGATVDTKQVKSAGNNSYPYTLRNGVKYSDIKVTRAVQAGNTDLMALVAGSGLIAKLPGPGTAVITLYSKSGTEIMKWTFHGVIPTGWTGPNGDVGANSIATETLTLSHKGPLPAAAQG